MATHDYVIDNSTGANVRADINNVLQAILTNNSSSSAPSTTAAYMWWADTTSGVLKIRNSSDNDWVELLQLDGTLTLEDGSESTPALAFRDDLDTGIFSSAADTFNVATAGTERMELGTATIFNEGGADVNFRIESDNNINMFFLDAGEDRIGIGTSTPQHDLDILKTTSGADSSFRVGSTASSGDNDATIVINNGGSGDASLRFDYESSTSRCKIYVNSSTNDLIFDTDGNETMRLLAAHKMLIGTSADKSSSDANAILQLFTASAAKILLGREDSSISDGDFLGIIDFHGTDGTSSNRAARIAAIAEGSHATDDKPTALTFGTCADNAANSTEAMRIGSDNRILMGTTSFSNISSNTVLTLSQGSSSATRLNLTNSGSSAMESTQIFSQNNELAFTAGSSGTEKLRIHDNGDVEINDGNLIIGTGLHGIDFSAQTPTSASNATKSAELLDHYEEGTWTPTQPTIGTNSANGHYTRIGRVVHCSIFITLPTNASSQSFVIDGLPFNTFNPDPSSGASLQGGYLVYSTYGSPVQMRTNQGGDRIVVNDMSGNNIQLTTLDNINFRFGLHYFTS